MRVKWITILALLAVLASLAVGGCGKKEATAQETITIWTHDNPDFLEATRQAIADFEQINPGIKVKLENFPYDVFIQKLKAAFAAGNEADVLQIFGTWATDYARKGYLDSVPEAVLNAEAFFPAALGAYTWQGKLYGLPHEYNLECGGMLVHPAMLQEAGVRTPVTWSELVAAAKALTRRDAQGITRAGFIFSSSDNITFSFLSFILQQGGNYWTQDQRQVTFSTPEARRAWDALLDLVLVDKVEDPKLVTAEEDISDYFYKGQAAMCYRGSWTIAAGLNTYNLSDFDYVPVPPFAGDRMVFAAESGWGEVVSARSEHKEAAWKLANFLTKDSALAWNVRSFTLPARKDVAANPKYVEQAGNMMKTPLGVLEGGYWIGPLWDRDQFFDIISRHFLAAADGLETREASLTAVETEINQMLAENSQ